MAGDEGKGYYRSGLLPHVDLPRLIQFVTFRLGDAVPAHVVAGWEHELLERWPQGGAHQHRQEALRARIERWSDAGHGSCCLRCPGAAADVAEALRHFDAERYALHAWVAMPDHAHRVVEVLLGHARADIVGGRKSLSVRQAHRVVGPHRPLCQRDYLDRWIRASAHYSRPVEHVEADPVLAGLAADACEWQFGNAEHPP